MPEENFLDSFPIQKRLMTAEEVLSALQQRLDFVFQLRQKPTVQLTNNYLIRDWAFLPDNIGWTGAIGACTREFWYDVAEMLIQQFAIELSESELAALLKRPRGTLGDLCNLIAQHSEREIIPDVRLATSSCQSAGLFLALRERLKRFTRHQMSIDPSSALPDRQDSILILFDLLAVLAPKRIGSPQPVQPSPMIDQVLKWANAVLWTSVATCGLALVMAVISLNEQFLPLSLGAFIIFLLFAIGLVIFNTRYGRWHWPGLITYRDLVRRLSS